MSRRNEGPSPYQGILVVNKPTGWTSFDVLAKLRGVLGTRGLGHSGTLDPMATGVLPVFVGMARKAVDMQVNHDKTYLATIRLGMATDTGDITGTVTRTAPVNVGEQELLEVLPRFVGEQMQLPPMYSAVKVNGQPLYKAARQGLEVERTPRPITVYSVDYMGSAGPDEYRLKIACSKCGCCWRTLAAPWGCRPPCLLCSGFRRASTGWRTAIRWKKFMRQSRTAPWPICCCPRIPCLPTCPSTRSVRQRWPA